MISMFMISGIYSQVAYGVGVAYKDVRILMGHSKEDITDNYIHASYARMSQQVAKLETNAYGKYPKLSLLREPIEHKSRKYPAGKKRGQPCDS